MTVPKILMKGTVNRRGFLLWAWGVTLAGLAGQAGLGLLQFLRPRVTAGSFGSQVVAGDLEEFAPGTVSYVPRGRFYVSRLEDGSLLALWQRCTHLGCTVPWREDEGLFHCPCHSSLFDRTGEVLGGPAPRPLDLFSVRLEEGDLIVETDRVITRQHFEPSQAFHPD
jgi:cytochrome b6-f complex iron-sulfur subunit